MNKKTFITRLSNLGLAVTTKVAQTKSVYIEVKKERYERKIRIANHPAAPNKTSDFNIYPQGGDSYTKVLSMIKYDLKAIQYSTHKKSSQDSKNLRFSPVSKKNNDAQGMGKIEWYKDKEIITKIQKNMSP